MNDGKTRSERRFARRTWSPGSYGISALFAGCLLTAGHDASASGGFFGPNENPNAVATAHQLVFSITADRTVLWDRLEYAGEPHEFAWVLPVLPGAFLELSSDAWFEALDAATAVRVVRPRMDCEPEPFPTDEGCNGGCSCPIGIGSRDSGDVQWSGTGQEPVTLEEKSPRPGLSIVHHASIGPYETVTIHSSNATDAMQWLRQHDYYVDNSVEPILETYASEGFDFIALRLRPGEAVANMKPVRVISPSCPPTIPLRMAAVGAADSMDFTLLVLSEAPYLPMDFASMPFEGKDLVWDYGKETSNWRDVRASLIAQNEGRTWLSVYGQRGALLSPVNDAASGQIVTSELSDGTTADTIAEAYVMQGLLNEETTTSSCLASLEHIAKSEDLVMECGNDAGCAPVVPAFGQAPLVGVIDARTLSCGPLRDMSVALTGMRPANVWVTRLETTLPRAALDRDLDLDASEADDSTGPWYTPSSETNAPCPVAQPRLEAAVGARWGTVGGTLALIAGLLIRRGARKAGGQR